MKNPALKISTSIQISLESRPNPESSPGQEDTPTLMLLCVSNLLSNDIIENPIKPPIEDHFIWPDGTTVPLIIPCKPLFIPITIPNHPECTLKTLFTCWLKRRTERWFDIFENIWESKTRLMIVRIWICPSMRLKYIFICVAKSCVS